MAFVLIGRIIAVDQQQTVASKNDATKTFQRRQVYLDCSRYDSITGEQLSEDKPLLEFGGKGLDQLNELCKQEQAAIPQAAAPAPQPQAAAPASPIVTSQTGTDGLPF